MQTFDATVDFDTDALHTELGAAIDRMLADGARPAVLSAVVRADGPTCGQGELYADWETIPALDEGDWVVTGVCAGELADQLRALLCA